MSLPDVDPGAAPAPEIYALVLYVVGGSQASRHALANLRVICDELLKDRYALEVIDLREFPALAGERHILAAPTLIRAPAAAGAADRRPVRARTGARRARPGARVTMSQENVDRHRGRRSGCARPSAEDSHLQPRMDSAAGRPCEGQRAAERESFGSLTLTCEMSTLKAPLEAA